MVESSSAQITCIVILQGKGQKVRFANANLKLIVFICVFIRVDKQTDINIIKSIHKVIGKEVKCDGITHGSYNN